MTVLRQHPLLHYFQGYHDIVQVLLLVLGVEVAIPATARLSLLRIRDFMLPTMSGTLSHLALVPAILRAADPSLAGIVYQMPQSLGLSATMTLYSHEIEEYGSIARVFDFLLASEAVIPVYLFAAVRNLLTSSCDAHFGIANIRAGGTISKATTSRDGRRRPDDALRHPLKTAAGPQFRRSHPRYDATLPASPTRDSSRTRLG